MITKNKKDKQDDEKKYKEKQIIKQYYEVKLEAMLPATVIYRILAETPEEAADLIKYHKPVSIQPRLIGKKDLHLKVYYAGQCVIKFIKKFVGG